MARPGCCLTPGDDDGLVHAVTRLLRDPRQARRMGDSGRSRVKTEFTWNQCAANFRAIAHAALKGRK